MLQKMSMISRSEFIAVYNKYSLMTAVNIKNMILENFAGTVSL